MKRSSIRPSRLGAKAAFRISPVTAGCALLLLSAGVAAQTAAPAQMNQVVVTGIRASIESAILVKKDSDQIVEAISAEDIGKLPDNSIAESIARLPGLAAQRVGGRAQTINIRGLSGDFAGTLLNGREQVSTGDNRAVEFDQYPSELLNGVVVYKTPDASLVGQGLSGTVNMQTVRPLSVDGRRLSLNLRQDRAGMGNLNPDSKSTGTRFSGTYIDKNAAGNVGWAVGYAHLENPIQYERWNAWGYTTTTQAGLKGTEQVLGGTEYKTYSGKNTRDSFMAVLEAKITPDYRTAIDIYHSKFDERITDRGSVTGLAWSAATLSNPVVSNGVLTEGTWNGVKPVIWQEIQKRDDTVQSLGWNNKWNLSKGLKLEADLSHAKAERHESIIESYGGAAGTDNFSFKTDVGTGLPNGKFGLNYADPNVVKMVDSGGWGQDGYAKYLNVTDTLNALRLNGSMDLDSGVFRKVDFGVNVNERKKEKNVPESLVYLKNSPQAINGILLGSTPLAGNSGSVAAWNIDSAYASLYNFITKNHPDIYLKQWSVDEKTQTWFGKATLDTKVGSVPLRGNVGLQVINTDQSSTALSVDTQSGTQGAGSNYTGMSLKPFTKGKSYTDVLPSMNLAFELADDQTLRVGAGKQMARARLDQLRASRNTSVNLTTRSWEGDGGSPMLDPFRADAIDIGYEKYFGNKAYLGAAYFYKKLKSYVYQQTVNNYDFSGATTSSAIVPTSAIGKFTGPLNGQGGKMEGLELSASFPLKMVAPALDGFGVSASYSLTSSNIAPQGPGSSMPLPGLSRHVRNLVAYYEKDGFSARIGNRSRSDYVGEIQGFGADRELVRVASESIVDLQFGYEVKQVQGLSLLLQFNNLTNAAYKEYYDTPDKPKTYQKYGRSVLFGANIKF